MTTPATDPAAAANDDRPTAFVLMPFSDEMDAVWERVLAPALAEVGYRAVRADSVVDQQNVIRDIVKGIDSAALIVADLTGLNPNVFYELGIAHGLRIPTMLITQDLERIPFDLRSYRVTAYSTEFDKIDDLRRALLDVGASHLAGNVEFGSPVIDFLEDEVRVARRPERPGDRSSLKAANEEAISSVADAMRLHKSIFNRYFPIIKPVLAEPQEREASQPLREAAAVSAAGDFLALANDLDAAAEALEASIERQQDATFRYVALLDADDDRDAIETLAADFRRIAEQVGITVTGMIRMYETTSKTHRHPSLDRALERFRRAGDRSLSAFEDEQSLALRAAGVADEKLALAAG